MTDWKETNILERDIILSIHKKQKSITEISKDVKRAKPTISESVKRLSKQGIVMKTHDYTKDARKSKISVNPKRIKIEKTHTFYLTYFILAAIPLVISIILSFSLKIPLLLVGCSIGILLPLLFIIYQAYIKKDKIIVYKNPKRVNKNEREESQKGPESS